MENGSKRWGFEIKESAATVPAITVRRAHFALIANLNKADDRPVAPLSNGDPSFFPCFRPNSESEDAIADALKSAKFNCYSPTVGILPARRAIADYLNRDLPYQLSPDDVFLTVGCTQAIEISIAVLSRPGANILVPRPGFPQYEAFAARFKLEVCHIDLVPENGWELDLKAVEAQADENTVALVVINPGNPSGSVYSHEHLKNVAETAKKLGFLVIADEVYAHFAFGNHPFVPMGVFGSIVPVLTLGSISKRWMVPGWRLGWLVATDPDGILQKTGVIDSITTYLNISSDPATFIQAAIPQILGKTGDDFFRRIVNILREGAELCYNTICHIPSFTCPAKPEGSMFLMAKLELSQLEGIKDDFDFCLKLAKEESVLVVPGVVLGMKNWVRVTFAVEPSLLGVGLERLKASCERHAKKL